MDQTRARGRARGRARNSEQSSQSRPGGSREPQSSGPRPQPAQPPVAWGPRAQAPQQQQQQSSGRAAHREGHPSGGVHEDMKRLTIGPRGDAGNVEGNSGAAGRGAVRGRRQLQSGDTLLSRPQELGSKKGSSGKSIRLSANYFELLTSTKWTLYQYRVDFAPDEERTQVKKRLFQEAVKELLPGYVFDGSVVFTSRRVAPDPLEMFVNRPEAAGGGDGGDSSSSSSKPVRITMRLVGDVSLGDWQLIQFFNIIMRRCLGHMKLQLVGRNFYDALAKISVPQHNIELWPGYVTSIRQHEDAMLLCCEIAHKFMRKENVLMVMKTAHGRYGPDFKERFTRDVIGSVVLTDYNNRTYRVDDVDWSVTPESKFTRTDGTSITYVQYYQERYQLRVRDPNQPLLVSRAKARELRAGMAEVVYLVPELCRMTGLTDAERTNMQTMRALAEHTRLPPEGRIQRLEQFARRCRENPRIVQELKRWDMQLAQRLVELPGRVLPPVTIIQGSQGNIKYDVGPDADWTRNLRSNQMLTLGKLRSWVLVCPAFMRKDCHGFVQLLQKAAGGMGMHLPMPQLQEVTDERTVSYVEAIERAIVTHTPSLVMIACPNNKPERYAAIKKKCCVDRPVPSQVILRQKMLSKGAMSIATKVAIQINCKLGGAPWAVSMPLSSLMVIGFDVCHDTMHKERSYGAMVASLDRYCTSYFTTVSPHRNGEELSNDFALNVVKAVDRYIRTNGSPPASIIVYRDGVGDGQLQFVYEHELQVVRKALQDKYYGDKPFKFAFIVVTKRINTRLFQGTRNPPPGTVVDDVITMPQRYDFFLVSQCVRQGTVSPTSYNVLYDSLGLVPDKLQLLTHKFTHMYYNWSGTVRVPAPCQYAHKLAQFVSQHLHRNPSAALDSLLHFL